MKNMVQYFIISIFVLFSGSCVPQPWELKSEEQPDVVFLSFSDAAACQDYGDLNGIVSRDIRILQIPFLCRTKYENKIEKVRYPATEHKINGYLSSKLESKYKMLGFDDIDTAKSQQIAQWFIAVLNDAAEGKGFPLQWRHAFPSGIIDSSTVIFFPFGIERESAEHVEARFYVLLVSPAGEVLFSRCQPYRADKWSSNIDVFVGDVEGKLPLLEKK